MTFTRSGQVWADVVEYGEDELLDMWRQYVASERTDRKLRDKLVTQYFPLAEKVAAIAVRKYPKHADRNNFLSWAQSGLLRAVANYDPVPRGDNARPAAFSTFAIACMRSVIMDGVRSEDWAPRSLRTRQRQIETARLELQQQLSRSPHDEEIAAKLQIDVDSVRKTAAEVAASWHGSIEEHMEALVSRPAPEPADETVVGMRLKAALAAEMDRMPAMAQTVLALHYFEELTLPEAARRIGVSDAYATSVHSSAVLQVNEALLRAVGVSVLPSGRT